MPCPDGPKKNIGPFGPFRRSASFQRFLRAGFALTARHLEGTMSLDLEGRGSTRSDIPAWPAERRPPRPRPRGPRPASRTLAPANPEKT